MTSRVANELEQADIATTKKYVSTIQEVNEFLFMPVL